MAVGEGSCSWRPGPCRAAGGEGAGAGAGQAHLQPEQLDEANSWYCPRCKRHVRASKKLDIWALPEILVVHLKRFSHSRLSRDKIDARVNFPLEGLDLQDYMLRRQVLTAAPTSTPHTATAPRPPLPWQRMRGLVRPGGAPCTRPAAADAQLPRPDASSRRRGGCRRLPPCTTCTRSATTSAAWGAGTTPPLHASPRTATGAPAHAG